MRRTALRATLNLQEVINVAAYSAVGVALAPDPSDRCTEAQLPVELERPIRFRAYGPVGFGKGLGFRPIRHIALETFVDAHCWQSSSDPAVLGFKVESYYLELRDKPQQAR